MSLDIFIQSVCFSFIFLELPCASASFSELSHKISSTFTERALHQFVTFWYCLNTIRSHIVVHFRSILCRPFTGFLHKYNDYKWYLQ